MSSGSGAGSRRVVNGSSEVSLVVELLNRLVDSRIDTRLGDLVERISAGIAAEVADRLRGEESGFGGGDRRLLTVADAAKRLSLSRSTVYELIRRGDLASIRVGGARRISPEAIEALRRLPPNAMRRTSAPAMGPCTPAA